MLRPALFVTALLAVACSDPAPPFGMDSGVDAGPPVFDAPSTDRQSLDRGPPPETIDLTDVRITEDRTTADVPCAQALPEEVRFGAIGGKTFFRDELSLRPPATFVYLRTFNDASPVRCETQLPSCGTPNEVDLGEVVAALGDADVTAAFAASRAMNNSVLYGYDSRPVDGTVFSIVRGGATVLVGDTCRVGMGAECVPVPVGVQRLVDVLNGLREQEGFRPACMALRRDAGI